MRAFCSILLPFYFLLAKSTQAYIIILLLLQIPDDNQSRGYETFNTILLNGSRDSNQFQ